MKKFALIAATALSLSVPALAAPGDNPIRRLQYYGFDGKLSEMEMTDPAKIAMFEQHAKKLAPGTLVMTVDGTIYILQDAKMPNGKMMSDELMH